jgi:hypothetical protein
MSGTNDGSRTLSGHDMRHKHTACTSLHSPQNFSSIRIYSSDQSRQATCISRAQLMFKHLSAGRTVLSVKYGKVEAGITYHLHHRGRRNHDEKTMQQIVLF